jgi:VanZ family protein
MGTACVVVLIVLSLLPGRDRPHAGSPGQFEHSAAYFATAVFLAVGFRTIRARFATIAFLVGLAATLEMFQLWVPRRHSQFIDVLASSDGAGFGALAVVAIERLQALSSDKAKNGANSKGANGTE